MSRVESASLQSSLSRVLTAHRTGYLTLLSNCLVFAPLAVEPTLCLQLLQPCGQTRNRVHIKVLPDTQQVVLCVLPSIQMRPISWMRQKMEVPPAMDGRQHQHESAPYNSMVDTKISLYVDTRCSEHKDAGTYNYPCTPAYSENRGSGPHQYA